jgi:radical SAM protein with 4Fe4S-binding SPASM domain
MMVQEPNYVDLKSPCGCVHGQIAYDLQGNIYPCDEARLNQKIILGNVLNDSFDEISRSQEALKIINASLIDTNRCGLCSYRPWCGRCPVINRMHFCEYDVPSEKTYGCRIWKSIFDRFFELVAEYPESIRFVESMIKADDIIRFQNPSIFNQKYGDHQLRDKSQKFGKLRL